jgi:hypothetical protein
MAILLTDSLIRPGMAVKVADNQGKLRDGVIKFYAYRGNISGKHYWMVTVKGLKKAKMFSEDEIQTAS